MTAPQTLPEVYPLDDLWRRDERARWLAVYGAAFVERVKAQGTPIQHMTDVVLSGCVRAAEAIADAEARTRAAWEAEMVRRLDTDEGP